MESGIYVLGSGFWIPEKYGFQLLLDLENGIRNPRTVIRNPTTLWIPLHRAATCFKLSQKWEFLTE